MRKNYFYSIILLALFALTASAQDNSRLQPKNQEATDALGFYPNPVSNGKIYITSKTTVAKEVTVFDVLGKKVLQYFLYKTFDEELMNMFEKKYNLDRTTILNKVYKEPTPNSYIASFTDFLVENRGHYMIEISLKMA